MAFCSWAKLSLPTEAQWERAAHGPGKEYRKFSWGSGAAEAQRANYSETKIGHVSPVGSFPSDRVLWNAEEDLWLADIAGNAIEWCSDWYGEKYYNQCKEKGFVKDPQGPETGSRRVLRGGSWGLGARGCRCACRRCNAPGYRNDDVGFRVVFVP